MIPVLLVFVLVVVAGARLALADQAVTDAARAGARAASLERTSAAGLTAGRTAAAANLTGAGLACDPTVRVAGNWQTPIGVPTTITTSVECRVRLADLFVPGLPGEVVISSTARSPLDSFRERR
ncbi:TadE/TadG family type IV pilus assembly protein [Propionibacteriaceae bacterium Y2011]